MAKTKKITTQDGQEMEVLVKRPFYKKKRTWIICVILLVVIAANSGENDTPTVRDDAPVSQEADAPEADATDSGEEEEASSETTGDDVFAVGDVIDDNDMAITVNSVRRSQGDNEWFTPSEGNEYLLVDVTLENTSDKEQTISSLLMFTVVDEDGRSYDIALGADTAGSLDGTIGVGRKMTGEFAVEVPEGKTDLELIFEPTVFGTRQIIIALD